MAPGRAFRLVQPWGADRGREATVSEHTTSVDAFVALDDLAERIAQTGTAGDSTELFLVDAAGNAVARPDAH